ncbi:hypothetical protein QYF61_025865 [Mycteria americana]|uniref:Uncharacterized protein n=1 Tax=Mycteria americana TaxID=33587 RepID=A0AAN7NVY5_MYCAM|nr:hypothetical protein QYF61_025865 [Mycteria americana]
MKEILEQPPSEHFRNTSQKAEDCKILVTGAMVFVVLGIAKWGMDPSLGPLETSSIIGGKEQVSWPAQAANN